MKFQMRMSAAVALWTISGAMAIMRSVWGVDWIGVWVVLLVGAAAVPTVWMMVEHVMNDCAQQMIERMLASDQETLDKLADAIIVRRGSTPIK